MSRTREDDRDNLKSSLRGLIRDAEEALKAVESEDVDRTKGAMFATGQWYQQAMKDARSWVKP